eukprot:TRINITY_DN41209_c0_g1_i1.p1 TRINITY_DN41209_c0_g1~~TRINITY_DN41209_c0_g1_i1.p1  ORF type:complete len:1001 (-),score=156.30 TRINITY_DN41209_c0_g1_i1:195-3197(-)
METYPTSWKACMIYSQVLIVCSLGIYISAPVGGRMQLPDDRIAEQAVSSLKLIFGAVLAELCFMAARVLTWSQGGEIQKAMDWVSPVDSLITATEYSIKLCYSLLIGMYQGYIVLESPAAPNLWFRSHSRPVICTRLLGWAVALPLLQLLHNRCFVHVAGEKYIALRSAPGMLLASVYTLATLLMVLTHSPFAHWFLLLAVLVAFILVCWDQQCLAFEFHGQDPIWRFKFGTIIWQQVSFAAYAVIFMLGTLGLISPVAEQLFYSVMDVTAKVLSGALMQFVRHMHDVVSSSSWARKTAAAQDDLTRVIQMACVPMATADVNGNVQTWNSSFEAITGWSCKDVSQKRLQDVVAPDCKEKVLDAMAKATATPDEIQDAIEVRFQKHGEGSQTVSMIRFVPQLAENGDVTNLTLAGYDLTQICDMKATEEQRSRLMGVVSHELRSPLHGMVGLATALEQSQKDEKVRRQLHMIKTCASRLLDLVTNAMELSAAEAQRFAGRDPQKNPAKPVDLRDVIEEVFTMTSMAVDKTGRKLVQPEVELHENASAMTDCPVVLGDGPKCIQLVYNLVVNALKFTEKGSVTLRLSHRKAENILDMEVIDTGKGISEEFQKKMFDPFRQEGDHLGDSRPLQGIGLGLSVCKAIADLHTAKITVKSALGIGTSIAVSFPCETKLLPPRKSVSLTSGRPEENTAPTRSMPSTVLPGPSAPTLVLTVDDDAINQEVLNNALQGPNMKIVTAMSGEEALSFMQSRIDNRQPLPDIVLLDIQMPGLSGFDVLKSLRERYEASQGKLPVIMLSAKSPADLTHLECLSIGATDFLAKPFNAKLLTQKMAVALKIRQDMLKQERLAGVVGQVERATKRVQTDDAEIDEILRREADMAAEVEVLRRALQKISSTEQTTKLEISSTASETPGSDSRGNETGVDMSEYLDLQARCQEQQDALVRFSTDMQYFRKWAGFTASQLQAMSDMPMPTPGELMLRAPPIPPPIRRRPFKEVNPLEGS